jgi:hypothetical protein
LYKKNTVTNRSAGCLEEKVYLVNALLGGETNRVTKALSSDLVYGAREDCIDLFQYRGLDNFIAHCASSMQESAWLSAYV